VNVLSAKGPRPVSFLPHIDLEQLVVTRGYWAVAVIVGLESMGIPLPGETILVLAAIYAASNPEFNIWLVVGAATAGAIIGDNLGYWIGREFGYPLALRYGKYINLSEGRIKLGQYLFMRHGGKVVFLGRFVALLRILAAFLAGVNRMGWWYFLAANASGGIIWASVFGFGGYVFGKTIQDLERPFAIAAGTAAVVGFIAITVFMRRNEARLQVDAERALPGPLAPPHEWHLRHRG